MSTPLPRGLLLYRALKLRCPRCGETKMFRRWLLMERQCSHCGLVYERDPGYFLGSIYVNYGLTAIVSTVVYVIAHFGYDVGNGLLMPLLLAYCILFPLAFFPYARAWWLAMDLSFDWPDPEDEDLPPPGTPDNSSQPNQSIS